MDESDERLVEALKSSIAQGRYEVGMGDDGGSDEQAQKPQGKVRHTAFAGSASASASGDAAAEELPTDDPVDGAFNKAMNAYRAARAAGDAEAMARAQAQMQEVVRQEMAAEEQPCKEDGKK